MTLSESNGGRPSSWLVTYSISVTLLLFIALYQNVRLKSLQNEKFDVLLPQEIELVQVPTRGDIQAPVQLIVFGNFDCPYCGDISNAVDRLEQQYEGQLRRQFVPVSSSETSSRLAAAALAFDEAGVFWEVSPTLYNLPRSNIDSELHRLAEELGLAPKSLQEAFMSQGIQGKLTEIHELVERLDLQRVPVVFVNGKSVLPNETAIRRAVEKHL